MPLDGVLQLAEAADELVHEHFVCDTRDHEDHTFCGVMFDVRCECELPLEHLELHSVSVRGDLGLLTVWHTADSFRGKEQRKSEWTCVYEGQHASSRDALVELGLSSAIRLESGE